MNAPRAPKGCLAFRPRWVVMGLLSLFFLLAVHHFLPVHAEDESHHGDCALCALQMMPALLLGVFVNPPPWKVTCPRLAVADSPRLCPLSWGFVLHRGPPTPSVPHP